jgi:hypothetical protein
MKHLLLSTLFVSVVIFGFAQPLRYRLQDRAYYVENAPDLKFFGPKSKALSQQFGNEFLWVGSKQYIQVYHFASYYRWVFKRFPFLFSKHTGFDTYYNQKNEAAMYRVIQHNQATLDALFQLGKMANTLSETELKLKVNKLIESNERASTQAKH